MQDGSVSPIRSFFRNKWVLLSLAIDIIIVIFIIVISINKAAETAIINFDVTPVDATITINGRGGYENKGQPIEGNRNSDRSYSLKPGTYEIQISHPDLDTKTFNLNLESNTNTTITTFLSKDGDFSFYTLRDNLSSFNRLAEIASAEDNQTTDHDTSAETFIANFQRNYDFYSDGLPLIYAERDDNGKTTKYISVRAGYNCNITLCLQTTVYDENDEAIVNSLIEGAGFNVEDFEIEYRTY